MKKNKKSKLKYIFIFIGVILVIFATLISYLVIQDLKQEDLLKKEIINTTNKDLLTDNFDIEVKTTGDYAYIEEAIKKYFKDLSDNIKLINNYLNDEDLIYILSPDNLEKDRPTFEKSYQTLTKVKDNSNKAMQTIINLCTEETIKNLIDKNKVDDYTYELYLELMLTEKDLEDLTSSKNEIETINNNLNTFLDKVEQIINLLKNNNNQWFIDEGQLYFKTDNLVTQYNNLYNDLKNFADEKFSKYNTNNENNI